MNSSQLTGILRAIIPALVAYLAGKGIFFDAATWNEIMGGLVAIIAAIWSAKVHTPTSTVLAAKDVPGVKVNVTPAAPESVQAIARDPLEPKVTMAPVT